MLESCPFQSFFVTCFRTILPFTWGKTYKYQKPCFTTFLRTLKECTHTCTFYNSKTDKCAVTVFTIKNKNLNVTNLKLRTLQGMILEQLLRRLVHFWPPFGSIWVVLVVFGVHFEFVTVHFRSLWLAFGSQISESNFGNTFSKAP